MENFLIIYFLKVSFAILLFYGLYILCLRNDTFHKVKRFYLLFIVIISVIYPFSSFSTFFYVYENLAIYQIILPEVTTSNNQLPVEGAFYMNIYTLILSIILSGAIVLFLKLIFQIYKIVRLRMTNNSSGYQNFSLIKLDNNIAPFSFFRWIFTPIDFSSAEDEKTIIAHEQIHVEQYHSIDVILYELFTILFWWNPIVWLLKKEMKITLEYLADEGTLSKGFEPKRYQYLLLEISNYNTGIYIANNFNVSQLKKRIIMINKRKSCNYKLYKYLFVIPLGLFILSANATNVTKTAAKLIELPVESKELQTPEKKTQALNVVEVMPRFPGGEAAMMKYISENLKYPESAIKDQTEGRVIIRFVVTETGAVTDVEVMRNVSPDCDAEAARVVKEMPAWTPGKQDGKNVSVYYTLPIQYKLQKKEPKK